VTRGDRVTNKTIRELQAVLQDDQFPAGLTFGRIDGCR